MYNPAFIGQNPTVNDTLAREFLFHDCDQETTRWGLTTVRLMYAKQALAEPYPLNNLHATPSVYISCRQDRTIHPAWWEQTSRQRLGVEPILMDAGHFPHVSRPSELAAILTALG